MVSGRQKAYAALALAFVLGAGAGGAATFGFVQRRHAAILRDDGGPMGPRRIRALVRKLDLDSEQEAKIRAILRSEGEENWRLGDEMLKRCGEPLHEHRKKVDAEIRAVLRPDQAARYDELAARGRFPGPRPRF